MTKNHNASINKIFFLLFMALPVLTGCTSTDGAGSSISQSSENEAKSTSALPFSENSTIFHIVPADSEARFQIDEILYGENKTVTGSTNQVSGQFAFDFSDPLAAAAGPIQVKAGTFQTDNGFRNRAIQSRILLSSIYENITFSPTAINGLPEKTVIGEAVEFQIEGDLTITAFTQPVTFLVTAIPLSESQVEGRATTTINRGDFELTVPSATGVAAVGDMVILQLDFVAEATE